MRQGHHSGPRSVGWRFALLILALGALAAALLIGSRWLDARLRHPEATGDYRQRLSYESVIEVDGVTYRPRKRVTTILLMGIDRDAEPTGRVSYRQGGQADFLRLLVIDAERKQFLQIQIDRDTITPITVLGVLGDRSGVRPAQIALSHAFGDGQEQSCELTVEAVSNLLLGIDIDFYVAMNLDGIGVLNDAVGGVTVTVTDDFSAVDDAMVPGATMTLTGEQAVRFVRSRRSIAEGTNENRMARQQVFMASLTGVIERRQAEDSGFVEALYDTLSPHIVTNLSKGRMINEGWLAAEYEHLPLYTLEGVRCLDSNGYMQFVVDDAALQALVLALFYEEVQ